MAKFSSDFLQELRDRLRLSDYVGRRVQLRRSGAESSGLCPFHNEKTPSFTVSDPKGFYHCFGCGAHGSVIDWVMETEGQPFADAVRQLASDAGLALPAETPEDRAATAKRQTLREVLEAACAWYEAELAAPEGQAARAYLAGRGLDADTISTFRLGYAPDGRGRLRTALRAQGATDDQLVDAGLMKRPEAGGPLRDYFFDRVMFPIADDRGRVVGFGGRTLGDSGAKYLNSPDNDVFHKGALLYNHERARDAARAAGAVIAVEGYMDVIALARAGIAHAVAPLGTAMGERQLELLWRLAGEPVLCFDGDAAGARAAARAADRALPLLKPGRSLRFAGLPAGEDPDSLLRKAGAAGLVQVLTRARPLVDVVWDSARAANRHDTPEARAAWRADLRGLARRITDSTVRWHYDKMLQERFGTAIRARRQVGGDAGRPAQVATTRQRPLAAPELTVRVLLATVVNHPEIGESVYEPMTALDISDRALFLLRETIVDWLSNPAGHEAETRHSGIDSAALSSHLRAEGLGPVLDQLMTDRTYVHARFAEAQASARDALRGWFRVFQGLEVSEVRLDLAKAKADFAADPSDDNLRRITELGAHGQALAAETDAHAAAPRAVARAPTGSGD